MNKDLKNQINEIVEPEKKEFQERLFKTKYEILGSRVPAIRKIAKENKNIDLKNQNEDSTYEELLLRGFIITYNEESILDKNELIEDYLERIDSWALCDSFCSTFKIKKNEYDPLFETLTEYVKSDQPFFQRYALVMLLSHFLKLDNNYDKIRRPKRIEIKDLSTSQNGKYINSILKLINRRFDDRDASLAASWLISEAFLFYPKTILTFLEDAFLDETTFKNAIKKIRESNIPDREVKEYIKIFQKNQKNERTNR